VDFVDNVEKFLTVAAKMVGAAAADEYHSNIFHECMGGTPIEQLFFMASQAVLAFSNAEILYCHGAENIQISSQEKIGKYRADFVLHHIDHGTNYRVINRVVVELDGHAFHDKDESQRRYEKARDRFFTSEGYKVLHFTGKEVTDNPFKVAAECISLLLNQGKEEFNPSAFLPSRYVF
jgi:very-short-patch-repair endonuclease